MAKKKVAKKKSGNTGRRTGSRAMASRQQPAARQERCELGRDHEIPRTHVTLAQIDTLVALNQQLVRQNDELIARVSNIEAKIEYAAKIDEKVIRRLETAQQRPAENQPADVSASILRERREFAIACRFSKVVEPTPAILGRLMHDHRIFGPNDQRKPRNMLELIYAKKDTPHHLSDKIRHLLGQYGTQPPPSEDETDVSDEGARTEQQPTSSRTKDSSELSRDIGPEFDKRFALIVKFGYGKRDVVKNGKKIEYHRYLTPSGRVLFNGWPEWTDATGGVGLVDEEIAPIPPSTPSGSSPANPTSVGGTDTTAAPT